MRAARWFSGLGVFGAAMVLAGAFALFGPAQMPPPTWPGGGGAGGGGGSGTVSSGTETQLAKYTAETTVGSQSTATFQSNGQLYVQGSAANDAMIFGNSSAGNGAGAWGRNSADGGQGLVGEATHTGAFPFTVRAPSGQTADLTRWLVNGSPVASVSAAGAADVTGVTIAGSPLETFAAPISHASLPTCNSAVANRYFTLSDSCYDFAYCDGSAPYRYFIGGQEQFPVVIGDYTAVAAAATTDSSNGCFTMTTAANASVDFQTWVRGITATTPVVTAYAHIGANIKANFTRPFALVLKESSSGKLIVFEILFNSTADTNYFSCQVGYWTNETTVSSTPITAGNCQIDRDLEQFYIRIRDDGTNYNFELSETGGNRTIEWSSKGDLARAAFITADRWGFGMSSTHASLTPRSSVLSLVEVE